MTDTAKETAVQGGALSVRGGARPSSVGTLLCGGHWGPVFLSTTPQRMTCFCMHDPISALPATHLFGYQSLQQLVTEHTKSIVVRVDHASRSPDACTPRDPPLPHSNWLSRAQATAAKRGSAAESSHSTSSYLARYVRHHSLQIRRLVIYPGGSHGVK
jgi:hypothetical protein